MVRLHFILFVHDQAASTNFYSAALGRAPSLEVTDSLTPAAEEYMDNVVLSPEGILAASLYKDYNKQFDIWAQDHRGSLNAVYAFLRDLGARWYMPGELGEIVPKVASIALPVVNRTTQPEFEVRTISRPLIRSPSADDALWYLRIGANEQYGVLHHATRVVTEPAGQRQRHPEYYALFPNGTP